jgi:hypothetical protein
MGTLDKESDLNADRGVVPLDHPAGSSPRPVPCFDAQGQFRPITRLPERGQGPERGRESKSGNGS